MIILVLFVNEEKSNYNNTTTIAISIICQVVEFFPIPITE